MTKFYITTAIPYVNADPHLGHALEFVQADAIRRYNELLGFRTFLTTGADENSLKNVQAAEKKGVATQELCDSIAEKFRKLAEDMSLSYDSFLRSSGKEHFTGSQKLWKLCAKDIYKKMYRGLYCVGCEAFYTETELENGVCPEHKSRPEIVEEENYFFRLSKYQKQLEKLIRTNKLKIIPEGRKNEVLAFIKSGLEDFSVSRSKKRAGGWGVPVPGDDGQIMYVWFDALNVYQTAIGFGTNERLYKKLWPADLHVIGKGILRFHAVYWPAILLSAGLKLPKAIFVHGYITIEGQKMSKSLGNIVDPQALIEKYGAERLRYYLLRLSPFEDGDFSEKSFLEKTNAEMVDNFSNLFYRVTTFMEKHFEGKVPEGREGKKEKQLERFADAAVRKYKKSFGSFRFNDALGHAMELSSELNRYFQDARPWEAVKDDRAKAATTLCSAANALNIICSLLYPFLPATSGKAAKLLGSRIRLAGASAMKPGTKIKSEMLFRRI